MTDLIDNQIMTIETYVTELKKEVKGSEDEKKVLEIYNKEADLFGEAVKRLNKSKFTYKDLNTYHNIFLDGKVVRGYIHMAKFYPVVDTKIIIFWITYFLTTDIKILAQNDIKVLTDAFTIIDLAMKNDACRHRYERLYHKDDPTEWFTGTVGKIDWPFGLDEKKYKTIRDKYEVVFKGLTPTD